MGKQLAAQISNQKLGDHVCLIYENSAQQMDAVVPFIQQGLDRNECCVYITDDLGQDEVKASLAKSGIQVEAEIEKGSLSFATKRDAYLRSGEFNPEDMISFLRETMEVALSRGFTGFRLAAEMTWALGSECGCDRLIEYEALLNEFFPGSRATALCQYNERRFSPEIIRDVLRTHPVAIIGDQFCSNLYYETPKMVLGKESAEERVDWMKNQLTRFRATEQSLEESIRMRDEFLSIASHELNTPLTSLNLHTQRLIRQLKKTDETNVPKTTVMKTLESSDRQIHRLSVLVNDLLDVSKIRAGKLKPQLTEVDLVEMTKIVVERFSMECESSGYQLQFDADPEVIVRCDRFRIEQVAVNLLSNALKYGEGKPVRISVRKSENGARLTVEDQGMGIAEEYRERIFNRFERAIDSTSISGLGLGLFISKEIVDAHGGKIHVDSHLGQGSIFAVELPEAA